MGDRITVHLVGELTRCTCVKRINTTYETAHLEEMETAPEYRARVLLVLLLCQTSVLCVFKYKMAKPTASHFNRAVMETLS